MSTKQINAGDTLTVGDLTDDYLGAEIEVGTIVDVTYRFAFGGFSPYAPSMTSLWTPKVRVASFYDNDPVKVIAPPPVVQPDEPTALGQMFRVEGLPGARGFRARGGNGLAADSFWWRRPTSGTWSWDSWSTIKERVGDHQIIVSDPPRWPNDDAPVVPERIEVGEWPKDDDTHLREWEWTDADGDPWWWDAQADRWRSEYGASDLRRPIWGPWTRGERVE